VRIGQYTDSFVPIIDGVGRVVLSYAKTLSQMGHETIVFTPKVKPRLEPHRFDVVTFNAFSVPNFQYRVGVPQWDIGFSRQARRLKLDIVHAHAPFLLGRSGLRYAKRHGIPIVGTFHSKYYDDFLQYLKSKRLARFGSRQVARFFERCDETWAVSEASAETLRAYGYRGEVIVMPNGTEARSLDASVLPELVSRFSIDQSIPLLLYVGQLNWKKNILRSLEAVRDLKNEGIRLQMLLAGKGPHQDEIERAIAAFGLSDCVRLIGHLQSTRELDGLYALADLFMFPSLYDNAPMVVREAAAMGTPSLLIQNSSAAESICDGYNGFACEDTTESVAAAIVRIVSDRETRDAVGRVAAETIPMPWTAILERAVARYVALAGRKRKVTI
jgi:glycosyltransferase involved in cell wall biosynthesis